MVHEPMASRSVISIRHGLLHRLTALVLLIAILPGCLATSWNESIIKGEPKETGHFALTTSANAYEITRWWGLDQATSYEGQETLIVPRRDLPAGCESARFFLNDPAHELQIAQPTSANWVTGVRPPLTDDSYPPCALLVSYGSFSEPPALEGVAVTSATGLVATGERRQPHPAAWGLVPVTIVVDVYIFLVALVTIPLWAPIGLMMENSAAKREQAAKVKEKGALPPPVAACWTAMDSVMKKDGSSTPDHSFVGFEWALGSEKAYVLTTANGVFSDDKPVPIDARVTLRQGRVQFKIENKGSLWTDADVECGLRTDDIVATGVKLRK
ncbi:MAG: hypothetical protein H6Q56_1033 [Deltaproteobacteria bacterium]|nr:hypothetical protein [Deltaproteobacteria bacterium]